MKKGKLKLNELKVESFVTTENLKGGFIGSNVCQTPVSDASCQAVDCSLPSLGGAVDCHALTRGLCPIGITGNICTVIE